MIPSHRQLTSPYERDLSAVPRVFEKQGNNAVTRRRNKHNGGKGLVKLQVIKVQMDA